MRVFPAMKRCILHVGMPKTGTSSIQESLFFGLNDPRFQYFTGGEVNTARTLLLLGSDDDLPLHFDGERGRDTAFLAAERQAAQQRLARHLEEAQRSGRELIVSGENCWRMPENELRKLKTLLEQTGLRVQVVAYVRPWKEWLESNFAQRTQLVCMYRSNQPHPSIFGLANPVQIDYWNRIQTFDGIFGRENVLFRKFQPGSFPGGCVTRDFCQLTGISLHESQIRRANDSMRLDAVRLIFAYGKFANREAPHGRVTMWQHRWLMNRLMALRGPALRFHSSVVEPLLQPLLPDLELIEERIGASMREDWTQHDAGDCIRTEDDLFRFSEESLAWLEGETGIRLPRGQPLEESARQVGALIHRLRHTFPGFRILSQSALNATHRFWIRRTRSR